MRILGINKGATSSGKSLRDGGAAIYDNGRVTVLSEARIVGVKYAGGYQAALEYLASRMQIDVARDFDYIAVSTCCEPESAALIDHPLAGHNALIAIGHHLSHASLSFYASAFREALVVVADGGGNTLPIVNKSSSSWWQQPREQFSYYIGRSNGLELLGRDFAEPYQVGLAELYRAFTYFLGWHSYVHASKVMVLAGLGDSDAIHGVPFEFRDGMLESVVDNTPDDPISMVTRLAEILGANFGEPRPPGGIITQSHCDVAAFIQRAIEVALQKKLTYLCRETGIQNVCLSGGLALNAVANGRLQASSPCEVYVPSAPGDDGQCLGNVYALLNHFRVNQAPAMKKSSDAYLGPEIAVGSAELTEALNSSGISDSIVAEAADASMTIAAILAAGTPVCMFGERSEFGPRALGARSILADPRKPELVEVLNTVKGRQNFMPFAPVMLDSRLIEHFSNRPASPFMSFAFTVRSSAVQDILAVVHKDGTARVQTVSDDDDANIIVRILKAFEELTGVPALLNTSFNLGGRPIVETVQQATDAFRAMPIPAMHIGRFLVLKPDYWEDDTKPPVITGLPSAVRVRTVEGDVMIDTANMPISSALATIHDLTGAVVFIRTEIPLYSPYIRLLEQQRKRTTTRFRRGGVEFPASSVLPLTETPDFRIRDKRRYRGRARVIGVRYQKYGELNEVDAVNDGFGTLEEMRTALSGIYSCLTDSDWVTIYEIAAVGMDGHIERAILVPR